MILPVTVTHSKDGKTYKRASNACAKKNLLLKLLYHSKWNVTQIGMSLKLESNSKLECHSIWNITQSWNLTQAGMSLKMECNSNWNVTQIGMSYK